MTTSCQRAQFAQLALIGIGGSLLFGACGTSHDRDGGLDAALEDAAQLNDGGGAPDAQGLDDGGAPHPFIEFCVARQHLYCEGVVACCTIPGRMYDGPCDVGTIRSGCETLAADPALTDGTLTWLPDEAARTLAELEARRPGCEAIDRAWDYGRVLEGTLEAGAECTPQSPRMSGLGRLRCRPGLRCELTGTSDDFTGTCAEPGAQGDSCNHDCGPGLFCQWHTDSTPYRGLCQVQDEAAECFGDFGCSTMYCELRSCTPIEPADTWCIVHGF
ncbi:MAG: hypothetical protein KF729_05125 [Sandaracinaceae bacterium]|nr:hypothetical protein [Sandaracinaceae bacterium]